MPNKLLILDNDSFMVKILTKLFSNLYEVASAPGGEEAIGIIKKGFSPGVIISSLVLRGMNGDDFLSRTLKVLPFTSRIILTSKTDTKELLEILTRSEAHLYINKPFNNLSLMQAVKLGFDRYNDKTRLAHKTPGDSATLQEAKERNYSTTKEILNLVSLQSQINENFYFNKHTNDVISVAKYLGEQLQLSDEQISNIVLCSMIHNHYLVGLPDALKLANPATMFAPEEVAAFFDHFKISLNNLKRVGILSKYLEMVALIFEHNDGSGMPFSATGPSIPKEIQVIAIVNMYFDMVYKLPLGKLHELKVTGKTIQSPAETVKRHKDAVTLMYKHIKWFDHDLLYKFNDMLKKRELKALRFNTKKLSLDYNVKLWGTPDFIGESKEEFQYKINHGRRTKVVQLNSNGEEISTHIRLFTYINLLESGQKLARDVKTLQGSVVMTKGTVLDQEHISKMARLLQERKIQETLDVIIEEKPVGKEDKESFPKN